MSKTCAKIKSSVGPDSANWTCRYAQLTFQTRVVIERALVFGYLGIDEHRSQQNEVAKLRVNNIAMNTHVTEASSHCDCFVRHKPELARSNSIHFHRKPHRRVDRTDANITERRHDSMGSFVYSIAGVMKFDVRNGTRGIANGLAVHSQDEADQRSRFREESQ